MKKYILLLMMATMLLASCDKEDEITEDNVTSVTIEKIEINRLPSETENGQTWDYMGDPDVYISLWQGVNELYIHDDFITDAYVYSNHTFELSEEVTITNFNTAIELFAYDDDSDNYAGDFQFMARLYFSPLQEGLPKEFTISETDFEATFYVSYH